MQSPVYTPLAALRMLRMKHCGAGSHGPEQKLLGNVMSWANALLPLTDAKARERTQRRTQPGTGLVTFGL
jgi:hypothetical protein